MSAADRMQHFDAYIDPVTHQVQQTIYLAKRNPKPADPTDLYEILSQTPPQSALDDAAPGKCKLTPFEQLPSYEM
jgi:branched-chain amino acid transport system substrate-binding protein